MITSGVTYTDAGGYTAKATPVVKPVTSLYDRVVALAKFGYANNNTDKALTQTVVDWARGAGSTITKDDLVAPDWSPYGTDWEDVFALGNADVSKYLNSLGIYSKADATKIATGMTGSTDLTTPDLTNDNDNVIGGAKSSGAQAVQTPATYTNTDGTPLVPATTNVQQPVAYDPVSSANQLAEDYKAMALRAGDTRLRAQLTQAQWTIDNGGIWKTLQPEYQKQLDSALATLTQISSVARANVAAQKASMDAEQAMNYQNALDDLDRNLVASRQRTVEEMNQRGLFFSTVLDSVMGKVEAASATQRGQLGRQNIVELGKIAAQIAALTANVDITELQGKAAAVAQYGAAMLQWIAQDEQTKQACQALIAGLEVEQKGLADTVGMEIFGTVQGIQQQGRDEAANIAETDLKTYLSSISQFSNNYQGEIDRLQASSDPNKGIKIAALMDARDGKLDNLMKDFVATMSQYSGNYQGEINRLMGLTGAALLAEPLRDRKVAYLRAALADQQQEAAAASTGVAGGSGGGGSSGGGVEAGSDVTINNALSIIKDYEGTLALVTGYEFNPETGNYEKNSGNDQYGMPITKSMSASEYQNYSNILKTKQAIYDRALQILGRNTGAVLSADDQETADSLIFEVGQRLRGQSAYQAFIQVMNSESKTTPGRTLMQDILELRNGRAIIEAIKTKYGITQQT